MSRNFPELRRVVLQSNMFDNHRGKNVSIPLSVREEVELVNESPQILDALLEVEAVRAAHAAAAGARRVGPRLVPFDQADTCQCCHNSFTW